MGTIKDFTQELRQKTGGGSGGVAKGPATEGAASATDDGAAAKRSTAVDEGAVAKRHKGENPRVYFEISIGGESSAMTPQPPLHLLLWLP